MMYWGMQLPDFQVGDTVRSGMAVAQIPDLKNWEVSAKIGELDRGHLAPGSRSRPVVALAGQAIHAATSRVWAAPPGRRGTAVSIAASRWRTGARAAAGHDLQHGDHRGDAG